ncbi:hypothetical protein ABTM60_19475, partial [Acinetobacter baumannii]
TPLTFIKRYKKWEPSEPVESRPGNLKAAMVYLHCLVYGTRGTREENEWMKRKAIFDAAQFRYRGNESLVILSDREALSRFKGLPQFPSC